MGECPLRFWFDWDRGTMNTRDLALKFDAYGHFVSSGEWAREHASLPRLLCVVPDMAQERRMKRVVQATLPIHLSQGCGPRLRSSFRHPFSSQHIFFPRLHTLNISEPVY